MAIPAFIVVLAAVVASVFYAGASGVASAESAARLAIPSAETVHLDARTYMVSFAVYDSTTPGLDVPELDVSIVRAGTGESVELREPTKRYFSAAKGEKVVDQFEIKVTEAGVYRVRVSAREKTDGFLLIGDRPINALRRVFITWVFLTVVGTVVAIWFGMRRLAKRGGLSASVAVRINRRPRGADDARSGP